MQSGKYGNIFDVLVDRPTRAEAIFDYPVVAVAGDADLATILPVVQEYTTKGGTLVVNVVAVVGQAQQQAIPAALLGIKLTGGTAVADEWVPGNATSRGGTLPATPYEIYEVAELAGAEVIAADGTASDARPIITRNAVGAGAVILTLVPHNVGLDERAHPVLPWLMNGLTESLVPVEVRMPDGSRPAGQIMYQINKAKTAAGGWVVTLMNNEGVDKTQSGIARVDRRAHVDVVITSTLPVAAAKEYT